MKKSLFMLLLASGLLSGCASIVGSTSETVAFNTNVEAAEAEIRNKNNVVVYSGRLPMTLSLKKKAGFFSGEKYRILVRKPGYVSQYQSLDTGLSGWYFGNLLFGGLIGLLIVDPATGAMWTFDSDSVFINLPKQEPGYPSEH